MWQMHLTQVRFASASVCPLMQEFIALAFYSLDTLFSGFVFGFT